MIRLSILALCLLISQANAGPKLDAEAAVVENVYAREYLFTKQTAVHPIQLTSGYWMMGISARHDLAILVAPDFSASCLIQGKFTVTDMAARLSDTLGLMIPQFLSFSLTHEKQCAAFVWERDGAFYGAAISETGSTASARLVSQEGRVVDIRSVDGSVSELSDQYLSAEKLRLLLNSSTPLGEIRRMAFQADAQSLRVSARVLEVRDGHRFLRLLDGNDEMIMRICSRAAFEERVSHSSDRLRGTLAMLSDAEVDIELVPYRNTSPRRLDIAAYVLCEER